MIIRNFESKSSMKPSFFSILVLKDCFFFISNQIIVQNERLMKSWYEFAVIFFLQKTIFTLWMQIFTQIFDFNSKKKPKKFKYITHKLFVTSSSESFGETFKYTWKSAESWRQFDEHYGSVLFFFTRYHLRQIKSIETHTNWLQP